jgi:hypothetical protein
MAIPETYLMMAIPEAYLMMAIPETYLMMANPNKKGVKSGISEGFSNTNII